MHVCTLKVELHFTDPQSLKAKRSVLKPIIEGARQRFSVAVAEVDHQNQWQRATIAIVAVASAPSHVTDILDSAERFIWSFPEAEVLDAERYWMEVD